VTEPQVPGTHTPDDELVANLDPTEMFDQLPTRMTDRVNGLEIARELADRMIYVPGVGRHVYVDGRWQLDEERHAQRWVGDWLDALELQAIQDDNELLRQRVRRLESRGGLDAALEFADIELTKVVRKLDADRWSLNTPAGTLDLRSGDLRSHDPRDLITNQTTVDFHPKAHAPMLNEFFQTFLPDPEHIRYLFKILGSTLLGGNVFRHLLIVHGSTTSGKSTLAEGIAATLGSYMRPVNVSVFRGSHDDKPRPDIMRALDARVIYASEAARSWELHGDMVKRMTGGDPVPVRGMQSNVMIERVPMFTPVIVTNEMPHIKGADDAVRRRVRVLPFDVTLPPDREDVTWKTRFVEDREVRRALLAQLVLGCKAAVEEGLSDIPPQFLLRTAETFDRMTHVADFLDHMRNTNHLLEEHPGDHPASYYVKASDLHSTYVTWIRMHGSDQDRREMLNMSDFGRVLKSMGWESKPSAGIRWLGKILRIGEPAVDMS
jgi:putative DNA primase/helicase